MHKISIVIANYNYGKYIRDAIDSCISQSKKNIQIIVVDDGSKDNSRDIIKSYGTKINSIFIKNSGQREANNIGFKHVTGDIVVFLDADDVLCAGALEKISNAWRDGCSKLQGRMQRVNSKLEHNGNVIPKITKGINQSKILMWTQVFGDYPSPPGSGNAYSKKFLEKIFPIGSDMDTSTDTTCISSAPYFGDIITIDDVLILYRMHGENDSNMTEKPENFSREINRAFKRLYSIQSAAKKQGLPAPKTQSLLKNTHILQLRIASYKLTPEKNLIKGESPFKIIFGLLFLPFRRDYNTFKFRLMVMGWGLLTFFSPKPWAKFLIKKRF